MISSLSLAKLSLKPSAQDEPVISIPPLSILCLCAQPGADYYAYQIQKKYCAYRSEKQFGKLYSRLKEPTLISLYQNLETNLVYKIPRVGPMLVQKHKEACKKDYFKDYPFCVECRIRRVSTLKTKVQIWGLSIPPGRCRVCREKFKRNWGNLNMK